MTFLQPAMLAALPIIALPIIIHLINQRRFQTIRWAAMMFLLAANRMSRGYARIRQWLILLFRTLAVAGLIMAVSRPLASGWLGLAAGGRADATLILLDRSSSMWQQGQGTALTKLESGKQQLHRSLSLLQSGRWLLVDSAHNKATEIEGADSLLSLPDTSPVSASADIPALLQTAYAYVQANRPSRTEVWICSDLRQNDWNADGGRWQTIRESFQELPQGVRFHLLAYPDADPRNRSIRVTGVRRHENASGAELLLSLKVEQTTGSEETVKIPVQLEIEGARSEITVELSGGAVELKDHAVPIERVQTRGWGRVSIPADSNASDNEFFFVFDRPTPRKTILVSDDPAAVTALQLAAAIGPDPSTPCEAETLGPDQLASVPWETVSLLMWHAPLPTGEMADTIRAFAKRGGQVIFFPPTALSNDGFAGVKWTDWNEAPNAIPISTWTGDQGLLANSQSGAALPVGQLKVQRYCEIEGETTTLASLQNGAPLLARAITDERNIYFCGTTPAAKDSSLATDGVVLYVMLQRAIATGASVLGNTRQLIAGEINPATTEQWQPLSRREDVLSTDYAYQAGVYQAEEKLFAVNRSEAEDRPMVVADAPLAGLFQGLDFDRVDEKAGSSTSLIEEIWRLFLAIMMLALILEAALCIPRRPQPETITAGFPGATRRAAA